ncbi:MAG: UDP-N-acetylmuramoyl-L-alanine--D-glutamate ligase [Candidatus Aegiribacteria sp.]|nr:UDP-N-acetylmuramoyl-L-alanine--D-glutamate ligase [Candidatus Aegiribacteria sp.]
MGYWTDGQKNVGVFGLGRSGRAAAALLNLRGFSVTGLDSSNDVAVCRDCVRLVTGDDMIDCLNSLDGIVISPGIDPVSPLPAVARELGLPVIGEIELAFRNTDIPVLAITGSNGKTTTAEWLGYTLKKAGLNACVAGNTGYPFSTAVIENPGADFFVLEVSSYQLQTIKAFRPSAAAILNITPDHLKRHGDIKGYINAKARIFMNQHNSDLLVLNRDDPGSVPLARRTAGLEWYFGIGENLEAGAFVQGDSIYYADSRTKKFVIDKRDISLSGLHNLSNALAVVCLAGKAGLEPQQMVEGLSSFPGVPHRIEWIGKHHGVSFVNDSKSTNPDSLNAALKSFSEPVILIAGGLAKEADYKQLKSLIADRVKALILIGDSSAMLENCWSGSTPIFLEDVMENAIKQALNQSQDGDIVLLSPGCASFDQYSSFEERGEHFRKIVGDLT